MFVFAGRRFGLLFPKAVSTAVFQAPAFGINNPKLSAFRNGRLFSGCVIRLKIEKNRNKNSSQIISVRNLNRLSVKHLFMS